MSWFTIHLKFFFSSMDSAIIKSLWGQFSIFQWGCHIVGLASTLFLVSPFSPEVLYGATPYLYCYKTIVNTIEVHVLVSFQFQGLIPILQHSIIWKRKSILKVKSINHSVVWVLEFILTSHGRLLYNNCELLLKY